MNQFKEHSVAEFFKKNKQMLGFSGKVRSMTMIVHELVTNSLDACEEHDILPEIEVKIEELGKDHYRITVSDNGPGISKENIGKALGQMLAGTKFHRYIQQRGQQGIGAAACTMYSYITTGKPTYAITKHRGQKTEVNISIDFKQNKPNIEIISEAETTEHGLMVSSEYKDVRYEKSSYGVFEYLRRTALSNPNATIRLIEPNGEKHLFPRAVEKNPPKPYEIKPHPLGLTPHELIELAKQSKENRLSQFLQQELARVSFAKVNEIKEKTGLDLSKDPKELDWESAEKLVSAFKEIKWVAPATDSLVPIGKEQIEASFQNIFDPSYLVVVERRPKVYRGGVPFAVEVGIAYGGGVKDAGKRGEVMRFANRVPLLFDAGGCAITETVKTMDWKRYNLKEFDQDPVAVLINVVSVHIPYTSAGKQAIAAEEELVSEIKNALMEAARGMARYISGKRKEKEIATKKKVVSRYVPQLSKDLETLTSKNKDYIAEKLNKIIDNKYVIGG